MSKECCGPDEVEVVATCADGCCDTTATTEVETLATWWRDRHLLVPIAAGVLLAVGYLLEHTGHRDIGLGLLWSSLVLGGSTFVPGALRRLASRRLGVALLMTIAAVGAVLLGRVGEAAALAFLFSIAEALEDRALDKARHGLRSLLSLIPETATVARLTGSQEVPAAELQVGDVLLIRAGDRVATDGVVTIGRSSIDSSAITGESIPVEVGPGDAVPAGAVNGTGALRLQATADGRDNSLTTIVRLVEQAQSRKGVQARLADRIARPMVPAVLLAAAAVALYGVLVGEPGLWLERALVVLVAASPCAMAIAVPVTVISAIGSASRFGVVIKSGEAFEKLGTVRLVAFDKTGTLTQNKPAVVAVETTSAWTADQVVDAAAALETLSTHPLGAALQARQPHPPEAVDVTEHPGQGISGMVGSRQVRVGSPRWVAAVDLVDACVRMETAGMTVIVVEIDGAAAGLIGIRDELKPEAAAAVAELHRLRIKTVMLTGDNARTAHALAAQAGISDVRAELMPAEKAAAIEDLRSRCTVAMVGDGVNDAPALAASDVGIAMGATGSAAAIESADVAFTGSDLRLIPQALTHAARGRRIMTGNIVLALVIIVVLFPLALLGVLGLAGVVLVHEAAEVVVILNGVRASRGRASLPPLPTAAGVAPELDPTWVDDGTSSVPTLVPFTRPGLAPSRGGSASSSASSDLVR